MADPLRYQLMSEVLQAAEDLRVARLDSQFNRLSVTIHNAIVGALGGKR